jgi:hypothetical protein
MYTFSRPCFIICIFYYIAMLENGRIFTISYRLPLCFVFIHLVYPILPVSLDCSLVIAPSVFSNVYILCKFVISWTERNEHGRNFTHRLPLYKFVILRNERHDPRIIFSFSSTTTEQICNITNWTFLVWKNIHNFSSSTIVQIRNITNWT